MYNGHYRSGILLHYYIIISDVFTRLQHFTVVAVMVELFMLLVNCNHIIVVEHMFCPM